MKKYEVIYIGAVYSPDDWVEETLQYEGENIFDALNKAIKELGVENIVSISEY